MSLAKRIVFTDISPTGTVTLRKASAGAGQGIWLCLTLAAGVAAAKTTYTVRETGTST